MKFQDGYTTFTINFALTPETVAKHFLEYTYYCTDSLDGVVEAAKTVSEDALDDVVQHKIELMGNDVELEYLEEEEMENEIKDCIVDIVHIFKRRFDW